MNLVNQKTEGLVDNLRKGINQVLNGMDKDIKRLGNNIEQTDLEDKVKAAFPSALLASSITLIVYGIIKFIEGLL